MTFALAFARVAGSALVVAGCVWFVLAVLGMPPEPPAAPEPERAHLPEQFRTPMQVGPLP